MSGAAAARRRAESEGDFSHSLPPRRSADSMSEAIALSSPSGRMSKRARKAAEERLSKMLWPGGCTREDIMGKGPPQPTKGVRRRGCGIWLRVG